MDVETIKYRLLVSLHSRTTMVKSSLELVSLQFCWCFNSKTRFALFSKWHMNTNHTRYISLALLLFVLESFKLQNKCKNKEKYENPSGRTTNPVNPVRIEPGKALVQVAWHSNGNDEKQHEQWQVRRDAKWLLFKLWIDQLSPVDVQRWEYGNKCKTYG